MYLHGPASGAAIQAGSSTSRRHGATAGGARHSGSILPPPAALGPVDGALHHQIHFPDQSVRDIYVALALWFNARHRQPRDIHLLGWSSAVQFLHGRRYGTGLRASEVEAGPARR